MLLRWSLPSPPSVGDTVGDCAAADVGLLGVPPSFRRPNFLVSAHGTIMLIACACCNVHGVVLAVLWHVVQHDVDCTAPVNKKGIKVWGAHETAC